MVWPRKLEILNYLFQSGFLSLWIIGAAGLVTAVLIHRRDKKSFIWPALPALVLWLACEVLLINIQNNAWEFIAMYLSCFAVGYAAAWLIMDAVFWIKGRKKD